MADPKTRIYAVGSEHTPTRLVRAANRVQAVNHVVGDTFFCGVPSQDELIELSGHGIKVETAGEEPADAGATEVQQ